MSLLPRDVEPVPGADPIAVRQRVAGALGASWTSELLTVAAVEPAGAVAVRPSTVVGWAGGATTGDAPSRTRPRRRAPADGRSAVRDGRAASEPSGPAGWRKRTAARLADAPARHRPKRPAPRRRPAGGAPSTPPPPARRADRRHRGPRRQHRRRAPPRRMARADVRPSRAARTPRRLGPAGRAGRRAGGGRQADARPQRRRRRGAGCVELAAPGVAALEPATASQRVHEAIERPRAARAGPHGAGRHRRRGAAPRRLPAAAGHPRPGRAARAVATPGLALVATTSAPEAVDPRLRAPELVDRELGLPCPTCAPAPSCCAACYRRPARRRRRPARSPSAPRVSSPPTSSRCAGRPPSAAAAPRHRDDREPLQPSRICSTPSARSGRSRCRRRRRCRPAGSPSTRSATWPRSSRRSPRPCCGRCSTPTRSPASASPRRAACSSTARPAAARRSSLRALAGTGQLNVLVVKGAELLDKYVGRVRAGRPRAVPPGADAAPALVFLDEVDALAPRRGQSTRLGRGGPRRRRAAHRAGRGAAAARRRRRRRDEPARADRPRTAAPGRLERLVYVPPPDAAARADILRAAGRTPRSRPTSTSTRSAPSWRATPRPTARRVLREAALTAMRESLEATEVTAAHLAAARAAVPPSLDPAQLRRWRPTQRRRRERHDLPPLVVLGDDHDHARRGDSMPENRGSTRRPNRGRAPEPRPPRPCRGGSRRCSSG